MCLFFSVDLCKKNEIYQAQKAPQQQVKTAKDYRNVLILFD